MACTRSMNSGAMSAQLRPWLQLPECTAAITKQQFYERFVNCHKPVVLRGAASHWPALRTWTLPFLAKLGVTTPVVVATSNEEREPTTKETTTLGAYVAMLQEPQQPQSQSQSQAQSRTCTGAATSQACGCSGSGSTGAHSFVPPSVVPYLKQYDLLSAFPQLRAHLRLYDLVSRFTLGTLYAWLGARGTVTGVHNDDEDNIVVQVVGRKRFLLCAPDDRPCLYPNSKYDSGTECCDVEPDNPNLALHPQLANATFYMVELCPGDVLFIPRWWYHHVRSLSPSVSVNFFFSGPCQWWRSLWRGLLHLLHCIGLFRSRSNCVCHAHAAS